MTLGAKMEYLEKIYLRYKRASRKEKSMILNEFCKNCEGMLILVEIPERYNRKG